MKNEKIKSDALSTDPSYKLGKFITDPPPGLFFGLGGLTGGFIANHSIKRLLQWLDKKGYVKEGGQIKKYLRTHPK